MSAPSTLLFLYMVPGTGHQKAAEAVMKATSHMDPRIRCESADAMSHAYPILGNVFNRMYLQMLKTAPFIWDYLYDNPDVEEATRDARQILTLISSFRIKRLLREHKPMAVICSQASPAIAMAAEKRKGYLKAPLIGIVTDFGVHAYWLQPEIDLYLVAHEDIKQELISKGIDEKKVRVTGIPIDPTFGETKEREDQKKRLHLHLNRPTILLMGGSHGLGPLDELVKALESIPLQFQTVVICGRNRRLLRKLQRITRGQPDFHILGYVRDTASLMSASDILITKPGGLTCSEALAMQLPMIVTNPLPGQEERNVRFLMRHQVAKLAQSTEDMLHILSDLLRHPKKIQTLRLRAKMIARPLSAWEASRLIFELINKRGTFASSGAHNDKKIS